MNNRNPSQDSQLNDSPDSKRRSKLRQRMQQNQKPKKPAPTNAINLQEEGIGISIPPSFIANIKSEAQKQFEQLFLNQYQKQSNLSFLWILIINNPNQNIQQRIDQLKDILCGSLNQQSGSIENLLPSVENVKDADGFLNAENCIFNVIVDLDNVEDLLKFPQFQQKILSIYLYLPDKKKETISKGSSILSQSKKFRGFYFNLDPLFDLAEVDLESGSNLIDQDNQVLISRFKKTPFPSFFKLPQDNNPDVMNYRSNAYASIKLKEEKENEEQRKKSLDDFVQLVQRSEGTNEVQMKNLEEYLEIDHIICPEEKLEEKHRKIIQFYTRESFYYRITNNLLRVCRSIDEFRLVTLPFSENYNAIKHFYQKSTKVNQRKEREIEKMSLYRGATLAQVNFYKLQVGEYIELFGFTSASKSQIVAQQFIHRGQSQHKHNFEFYMFIIEVPKMKIPQKLTIYDHGFVDLKKAGIESTIEREDEVILNALNIYKVTKIIKPEDSEKGFGTIRLEYGAIFKLNEQDIKGQKLSEKESSILTNYRYCMKEFKSIKDLGDILLREQKLEECQKYLQQRIQNQQSTELFNRLAQAQYKQGKIEESSQNAIKSLEKYQKELLEMPKNQTISQQKRDEIVHIQSLNKDILVQGEDTFKALKAIGSALDVIDRKKDWLLMGQKLKERGEVYLKAGNFSQSGVDLKQAQKIIIGKKKRYESKLKNIEIYHQLKDMFKCAGSAKDRQKLKESEIKAVENQYPELSKEKNKVIELLLKINELRLKRAQMVGNKSACKRCAVKAKKYFSELTKPDQSDKRQCAKQKILEAKTQFSMENKQQLKKSYQCLQEAINILGELQPMSEQVGDYMNLMGVMQKQQLENSNLLAMCKEGEEGEVKDLDLKEEKQKFQSAVETFQRALEIVKHNKSQDHPAVLEIKNNIGDVEYKRHSYRDAIKYALEVLDIERGKKHTLGAISALLVCKSSLAEGQTKRAFLYISKSLQILRNALLKDKQGVNAEQYKIILKMSPIYIELQLFRIKVQNRQTNRDLSIALKQVEILEVDAKKNLKSEDGSGFLAGIYEEKANIYVQLKDFHNFVDFGEKALKARREQTGNKMNIQNAVYLCIMAQYLITANAIQCGYEYLAMGCQIFSRYPKNNSFAWLQWSIIAQYSIKLNDFVEAQKNIAHSFSLLKSYSPNHINSIKTSIKYAEILVQNNKLENALKIYKTLDINISKNTQNNPRLNSLPIPDNLAEIRNEKDLIQIKISKYINSTQTKIKQSKNRNLQTPNNINLNEQQSPITATNQNSPDRASQMNESMQRIHVENEPNHENQENQRNGQSFSLIGYIKRFFG